MEQHHPIMDKLGGLGVRTYRQIYVRWFYIVVYKLEILQHALSSLGFKLGTGYHPYPLSAVRRKIGVLYISGQHA